MSNYKIAYIISVFKIFMNSNIKKSDLKIIPLS